MAWSEQWTVDIVEQNYKVIGIVDPEDINQLIFDSRRLNKALEWLEYIHDIGGNLSIIGLDELKEFIDGESLV